MYRRRCFPEHALRLGLLVARSPPVPSRGSSAAGRPKPHAPDLFAPRSASKLHPVASLALRNYLHISASSRHRPQDCPSTYPSFFASGGLRHLHTSKTSMLASTRLGDRLLRAASGCKQLCCRSQTDLRGTSIDCGPYARMTPYLGPGARVGALSFRCSFGRAGSGSRRVFGLSFSSRFYSLHASSRLLYRFQYMRRSVLCVGQTVFSFF